MPPASLPALAAIRPGPSRPRTRRGRGRGAKPGGSAVGRVADRTGRRGRPPRGRLGRARMTSTVLGPPSRCPPALQRDVRAACVQSSPSSPKRRRQPRGSIASSTSSTVTTPIMRSLSSTTGIDGEVVVGHQPRDLLEVGVRRAGAGRLVLELALQAPSGLGAQQRGDRDAALERRRRRVRHEHGREQLGGDRARAHARRAPRRRWSCSRSSTKSGLISPPASAGS